MIDPNDYFGPPPEKAPPKTEEEKIAAFKAIKAKLAAADPAADINHVVRQAQKKADQSKNIPTKIRHLGLAIGDIENLKAKYHIEHQTEELQVGSEDYFIALDYFLVTDQAITQLRQAIAHLELDAETEIEQEAPVPEQIPPTCQSPFPDQMDAEQVALYIHRNVDVVYRYAREGKIPAQYIDTHPLFSKKAIDEWLAAHSEATKPAMEKKPKKRQKPDEPPIADIHPKTLSRIDKLVSLLYEKGYLSQSESLRFKNWMLSGTRRNPGDAKMTWLKQRKSLVTCIVLCHYAELISIPESQGKKEPRPDFAAAIERDFIAEGKPSLQNIDRDFAKDIDREVNVFVEYMQTYAMRNELDFSMDNALAAALAEYYDDIDGSEGMAVEAKEIKDNGKNLDFQMLKLFHALSTA